MSASSFPTVLSEIFRLLSSAITEPHLPSVHTPKETNASLAASHHVKESLSFSEKQCVDASTLSSLSTSHSDSSYPPVSGFGAAPLLWCPYVPDSSVPLVPSLLSSAPHSPWDFLFSKGEKARRKWRKLGHDHTITATSTAWNSSTNHVDPSSDGSFLSLSSSRKCSHEEEEEEEEVEEDVVVSYFVKHSYALSRLCSRASPWIGVPSLSSHSAVGGTSSPSPGALGRVSDTEKSGMASPFFLSILHPQHHRHPGTSYSSSFPCGPRSAANEESPLDEIQRVQEISTLLALLHRSRAEYEGNPAFTLFWRNVVVQRVGAELLSSLEESWEAWKHLRTGATCQSYASPCAASVDAAAPDGISSTATRAISPEPFSARCMLYAEAFLFYTKHRVEELFDMAARHRISCPAAWPQGGPHPPTGVHARTQERENRHDEETSSRRDDPKTASHPSFSFSADESHKIGEKVLVPEEDSDVILHRVFRLLREFADRNEEEPFQKRVTLLLLGVLCVWNRVSLLLYPIHEGTPLERAYPTTISTPGTPKDTNEAARRSPPPPTGVLYTLQEELMQHFYQHFETTMRGGGGACGGGGGPRSTADVIGDEAHHVHNEHVLSRPSFFVGLLLLQYPLWEVASSSCFGGGDENEKKKKKEGCASVAAPSPEMLEAHLEKWNRLAPLLTYGRMYDIDFTVIIEMDGTQSVLLHLLKELMGEVERAVWAQIHHPSWWSHFSFPSLLSVCRGVSLFSHAWISCAPCAMDPDVSHSHVRGGTIPGGIRWLLTYVQSSMCDMTQEVCEAAWKREALEVGKREETPRHANASSRPRPPPSDAAHGMKERSLYSFPSVWGNATTTTAPPTPSTNTAVGAAFPISSPPLDVTAVSCIRQSEEKMNAYLALYAHLCALFIEWDVDGESDAGRLLFLPFSPQGEGGAEKRNRVDEPDGGDGEGDRSGIREDGAASAANDTKSGKKRTAAPTPTRLTSAALAAVDALFASSLSCSCPYSTSSSLHTSTPVERDAVLHIPLLPKYMLFLRHILQSPRLEQLLRPVTHGSASVVQEVQASFSPSPPPPSSSASSTWTLSVSEGVFLESACTLLFSILEVVGYLPDEEGEEEEEEVENEKPESNKRKASTRETHRMLPLLEAASGGISFVALLQQLFVLYTAVRKPHAYVVARLFTCVEQCYREVSKREGNRGGRRRWEEDGCRQRTIASPKDGFPGQYPGLSFPFLAAKVLLVPSLLQRLGESPGSACLGVLQAHLYGIFAALEQHKHEEEEDNGDHDGSLLPFPTSSSSSLPFLAHLLGCLTYLSPGQLSYHSSTLNFYLTILRYVCSAESIFPVALAEDDGARHPVEEWDTVRNAMPPSSSSSSSSSCGRKGRAATVLSRQRTSPPLPRKHPQRRRRWWWWWVEKNASRLLCAYPSLLSTLMEAATALQGRVAAGYLYGVQGPLQGALERTWRLIAILTTTGRAHTLLVNTVIPVVAHTSLTTAGPSFSPFPETDPTTAAPLPSCTVKEGQPQQRHEDEGNAVAAAVSHHSSSSSLKPSKSPPHYATHGHTIDIPAFTLLLEVVFSSHTTFAPQTQLLCASLWCACLKSFAASNAYTTTPYAASCSSGGSCEARSHHFHVLRLSLGTTASRLLAALRPSFYSVRRRHSHASFASPTTSSNACMVQNGLLEKLVESLWMERGEVSNILRLQVLLALQRLDSRLLMQFLMAPQFAEAGEISSHAVPTDSNSSPSPSKKDDSEECPPLTSLTDLRFVQFLHDVVHASPPSTKEEDGVSHRRRRRGSRRGEESEKAEAVEESPLVPPVHPQERALAWFLLLGMKLAIPSFFPSFVVSPESRNGKDDRHRSGDVDHSGGGRRISSILFPFSAHEEIHDMRMASPLGCEKEGDHVTHPQEARKHEAHLATKETISGAALYQAAAGLHFWLSIWLAEKQQQQCGRRTEEDSRTHRGGGGGGGGSSDPTTAAYHSRRPRSATPPGDAKPHPISSSSSPLSLAPFFAPLPSSTGGCSSASHPDLPGVGGGGGGGKGEPQKNKKMCLKKNTTCTASFLGSGKAWDREGVVEDTEALWYVVVNAMAQLAMVQKQLSMYLPRLYRCDTSQDWWDGVVKDTDTRKMALLRFFSASPSSHAGGDGGEETEGGHGRSSSFPAPTHSPRMAHTGGGETSILLYPLVLVSTTVASASRMAYEFLQGLPEEEGEVWNTVASLLYSLPSYGYALEKAILFYRAAEVKKREESDGEEEDVCGGRVGKGGEARRGWMTIVVIDLIATLLDAVGGAPFASMAWLQEQSVTTCFRLLHTMASTGFFSSSLRGGSSPTTVCGAPSCDDAVSVPAQGSTRPPSPVAEKPQKEVVHADHDTEGRKEERVESAWQRRTTTTSSPPFSLSSPSFPCPTIPSSFTPRASGRLLSAMRFVLGDLLSITPPWRCTGILTHLLLLLRAFPVSEWGGEDAPDMRGRRLCHPHAPESGDTGKGSGGGEQEKKEEGIDAWQPVEGKWVLRRVIDLLARQWMYLEKEEAHENEKRKRRGGGGGGLSFWMPEGRENGRECRSGLGKRRRPTTAAVFLRREREKEEEEEGRRGREGEAQEEEESGGGAEVTRVPHPIAWRDNAKEVERDALLEAAHLFFITHGNALRERGGGEGLPLACGVSLRTMVVCLVHRLEDLADRIHVWGPSSKSNPWVARFMACVTFLETLVRQHPMVQLYLPKSSLLVMATALGQLVSMPAPAMRVTAPPPSTISFSSASPSLSPLAFSPEQGMQYQRCAAQELWCALLALFRSLLTSGGEAGVDSLLHHSQTGWMEAMQVLLMTPRFQWALSGFSLRAIVERSGKEAVGLGPSASASSSSLSSSPCMPLFIWDVEEWYLCVQLVSILLATGCPCFPLASGKRFPSLVRCAVQEVHSPHFWARFRVSNGGPPRPSSWTSSPKEEEKSAPRGDRPRCEVEEEPVVEHILAKWYVGHIIRDALFFVVLLPPSYGGWPAVPAIHGSCPSLQCCWPSMFSLLYRYIARQVRTVVQQMSFILSTEEEDEEEEEEEEEVEKAKKTEWEKGNRHRVLQGRSCGSPPQGARAQLRAVLRVGLFSTSSATAAGGISRLPFHEGSNKAVAGRHSSHPASRRMIGPASLHGSESLLPAPFHTSILSRTNSGSFQSLSRSRSASQFAALSPSLPRSTSCSAFRLSALLEEISLSMESIELAVTVLLKGGQEIVDHLERFSLLAPQEMEMEGEFLQYGRRLIHTLESIEKGLPEGITSRELIFILRGYRQHVGLLLKRIRVI